MSEILGLVVDIGLGALAYKLAKQVSAALLALKDAVEGHVSKDLVFHEQIEKRVSALEDRLK